MSEFIKVTVNRLSDIAVEKRMLVDELKIVGSFNINADLPEIRKMCNTIIDGKRTGGNLSLLDIDASYISYIDYQDAFKDCISLKTVILHPYFGLKACQFSGCKRLERIIVSGGYAGGFDIDGVLFTSRTNLEKFPANHASEYELPAETQTISDLAFEDCHLTRLVMPSVPPTCTIDAFKGVDIANITLAVPKGTHDSYWMHPVFGKFHIEEIEEEKAD